MPQSSSETLQTNTPRHMEDDDDFSGELFRLSQIERNLTEELNRHQWRPHKHAALKNYDIQRSVRHREDMWSIAKELCCARMRAVRRRQLALGRKAFVRSRLRNGKKVGDGDRGRTLWKGIRMIRNVREREDRGVWATVADVAFLERCDVRAKEGDDGRRMGDDSAEGGTEGRMCVLLWAGIATAYALDHNAPHRVLLWLCLPSLFLWFVSKYPFHDEKLVFVGSIVYLCHWKRLSFKESVD